jgi:Ku protein
VTGEVSQTVETSPEVWRGTISFSLVAIPVRLVEAISPGRVSFRMLHRKDYAPLVSRMLCPHEGKIVPSEEIIRGYEYKPGRYIPITAAELESVSPERSRTIEVTDFVSVSDVDTVYFDYQYYLLPMKGGEKPYRLLVEVLRQTAKAGVASLVLAEREYPVLIRSKDGLLAVNTLHYPNEIVTAHGPDDAATPGPRERVEKGDTPAERLRHAMRRQSGDSPWESHRALRSDSPRFGSTQRDSVPILEGQSPFSPTGAEKELMKRVIGKMVTKFDPEKYADRRREKIVALLKRKMKGKALVQAPEVEEVEGKAPSDLAELLETSMRKSKKRD